MNNVKYFKSQGITYETRPGGDCKTCAFKEDGNECIESLINVPCYQEDIHWIKSPTQQPKKEPDTNSISSANLNKGMAFTIKAPYPQAYIIMHKETEDKSYQFKGPRIYVDPMQAKKRCDELNRYAKGKPHIVVGFDLIDGEELEYV